MDLLHIQPWYTTWHLKISKSVNWNEIIFHLTLTCHIYNNEMHWMQCKPIVRSRGGYCVSLIAWSQRVPNQGCALGGLCPQRPPRSVHKQQELNTAPEGRNEGNVLFNDTLNTFYLRLYSVRHTVKDHSDSERGNPVLPHGLCFLISSKGSFICIISQTG